MILQAICAFYKSFQAATGHDIHVCRTLQVAFLVGVQTIAPATHFARIIAQYGRQVLRGSQIGLVCVFVHEPDPTRAQAEQCGYFFKCRFEGLIEVDGLVERMGNRVED